MSPGACFCYYTLCPLWLQLSYDFYDTPSIEKRLFSLASLTCPFRKYLNLQAMAIAFPLRHLLSFFIFPKDILAYLNGSIQCPLPIISAPFPPSNVFLRKRPLKCVFVNKCLNSNKRAYYVSAPNPIIDPYFIAILFQNTAPSVYWGHIDRGLSLLLTYMSHVYKTLSSLTSLDC